MEAETVQRSVLLLEVPNRPEFAIPPRGSPNAISIYRAFMELGLPEVEHEPSTMVLAHKARTRELGSQCDSQRFQLVWKAFRFNKSVHFRALVSEYQRLEDLEAEPFKFD